MEDEGGDARMEAEVSSGGRSLKPGEDGRGEDGRVGCSEGGGVETVGGEG